MPVVILSVGFIAFSAMLEMAQKIKMFFALAPVISIRYAPSFEMRLLRSLSENAVKVGMASCQTDEIKEVWGGCSSSSTLVYLPSPLQPLQLGLPLTQIAFCSDLAWSFQGIDGLQ